MFGRVNRLLVIALFAAAAFVVPSTAYADCGGGPSAQNVYSECVPDGSGGKKPTVAPKTSVHTKPAPVSNRVAKAISKAGADSRKLSAFVRGGKRVLPSPGPASDSTGPSVLGSAFDLGSGPLALLLVLAGTAVALLGATVLRGRHSSRRS